MSGQAVRLPGLGALRQTGNLFGLGLATARAAFVRPFQWRELIQQAWFLASVTILPTILVSIPFGAVISPGPRMTDTALNAIGHLPINATAATQ